jgi:hypothetical protein
MGPRNSSLRKKLPWEKFPWKNIYFNGSTFGKGTFSKGKVFLKGSFSGEFLPGHFFERTF